MRSCCRELVQVAFSQRRKLLRHTLGNWLEQKGFSGDFDVQRRAEEVPVAEYLALAAARSGSEKPVARTGFPDSQAGLDPASMPRSATADQVRNDSRFTPLRANNPR